MSLFTRNATRLDTFAARIQRAKKEGSTCGSREGKSFRLAVKRAGYARERVYGWLNSVVYEGRAELEAQHALELEIEAWDMSCRIAFMVEIT
jgi:hypothetical protein